VDTLVDRLLENYAEWKLLANREHGRACELQEQLEQIERELQALKAEAQPRSKLGV
jgi:hypothetical protein